MKQELLNGLGDGYEGEYTHRHGHHVGFIVVHQNDGPGKGEHQKADEDGHHQPHSVGLARVLLREISRRGLGFDLQRLWRLHQRPGLW